MRNQITTRSKTLTVHDKINIRSYYSNLENRNKRPYQMTFGFLDIWTWNIKPFKN